MISEDFIVCDNDRCGEKIKNHRWGKTKAAGWFFSRDNKTSLCPRHVPEWYAEWKVNR